IVRVGADFGPARKVNEFQMRLSLAQSLNFYQAGISLNSRFCEQSKYWSHERRNAVAARPKQSSRAGYLHPHLHCLLRNGRGLSVDHLYDFYASPVDCGLKHLFENPHPVFPQNFFDLLVAESALDQPAGEIARVRMVPELGNEMRTGEFCGKLFLPRLRPLAIDEFKEIETDPDAIDANQIGDVFNVIDVTIHRAFFFSRAHQQGIHTDYTAPFADHFDLCITDVALNIVIAANIRVRHDGWLFCNRENFVKPRWIDVREINNDAEPLAFAYHVAPKAS